MRGWGGYYRVNAPVLEWSSMFGSLVLYVRGWGGGGGGYGGCYRVNAPVLEWSSMFGSLVLYGGGDFMEGTNFISINAIPLPVQY